MNLNLKKRSIYILVVVALCLYIAGFLSSYPYLLEFNKASSSKLDTARNVVEYAVMFLSFLLFCVIFLNKNIINYRLYFNFCNYT